MAIDPMIANPARVKLADPMEQYNNYLLAATRKSSMDEARRKQQYQNALRQVFKMPGVLKADGTIDQGVFMNALAQADLGDAILDQSKGLYDLNKTAAETSKETALAGKALKETEHEGVKILGTQASIKKTEAETQGEKAKAFSQAWGNAKEFLASISPDPKLGVNQYAAWIDQQFNDPVISETLRARGMTPEQMKADLTAAAANGAKGFHDLVLRTATDMKTATKQNVTTTNLQNRIVTRYTPEHSLTPQKDVVEKMGSNPDAGKNAPRTTVVNNTTLGLPAVNAFQDAAGGEMGKDFANLVKVNKGFEQQVARTDRMLDVLDSGDVYAGAGGKIKLDVARYAKALGVNVDTTKIKNSEMLNQYIAQATLDRIATLKSQGVQLTPMSDNDAKRIENAGPQAWQDPETLKALLRYEREAVQIARRLYNQQADHYRRTPLTSGAVRALGADPMPEIAPRQSQVRGTNGTVIPPAVIQRFLANKNKPEHRAEIDRLFGPGTAKQLAGGN